MCACVFEIMFTFLYVGWEWTMNGTYVFLDALVEPKVHFPWLNEWKYYLVDFGCFCTSRFLPPYQGECYHLQEYRDRHNQPTKYK